MPLTTEAQVPIVDRRLLLVDDLSVEFVTWADPAVLLDINQIIPSKRCKVLSHLFPQIFILM
jgi:hypothetical protein